MAGFLFKWLFIPFVWLALGNNTQHPIFVSVTEVEHNAKQKTLEVSCKIFTDDFEKTLRANYKTRVDLQDAKIKPAMDKLVNDYVQKNLTINVDGKTAVLKYLGFEKIEEAIYIYFESNNIITVKKLSISNKILFDYSKQQINLMHITVNGKRQSIKLSNPESIATIFF